MFIRDAHSNQSAEVNSAGELLTKARTQAGIIRASELGNAYSWDSTELDIDAGDTMLFVQNTSDIPLILDSLIINGSNVICTWDINTGTDTTTAAGTTVAAANLNTAFTTVLANATAFSDETAVADGTTVARVKTIISGHHVHDLTGLVLAKNHYIQINQETESTSGSVILIAHYQPAGV